MKATSYFMGPIMMMKKSKSGEKEVDITSFIKRIEFDSKDGCLIARAILSAGSSENLNPEYIVTALRESADLTNDLEGLTYRIMRNKVYDGYLVEFR